MIGIFPETGTQEQFDVAEFDRTIEVHLLDEDGRLLRKTLMGAAEVTGMDRIQGNLHYEVLQGVLVGRREDITISMCAMAAIMLHYQEPDKRQKINGYLRRVGRLVPDEGRDPVGYEDWQRARDLVIRNAGKDNRVVSDFLEGKPDRLV